MSRTHWPIEFVGDEHVGPDRRHDRVAVQQAPGVLDQELQERERLRPQGHLRPVRCQQRAAGEVQGEAVEAVNRAGRPFGVHRFGLR